MSPHTELPGGFLRADGPAWQRIRRHAVPGWMIEQATAHRLAGDWRAACASAAVDIAFDLPGLAARHGAAVAEAVEDDLRHLAPDLLRWHLPRVLGGRTTLTPDRRILLATYGATADAPVLSVTTTPMIEGSQRLRMQCAPVDPKEQQRPYYSISVEDWTTARPLWDARRSAELRERFGGGSGRLPFFRPDGTPLGPDELPDADPGAADSAGHAEWVSVLHARGDIAEAYAAAGIERDLTAPTPPTYHGAVDPEAVLAGTAFDLTRLRSEVRRLAAAGAGDRFRFSPGYRVILLEPVGAGPDGPIRAQVIEWNQRQGVPLPQYAWQRLPDLELVRTGRITPRELHPLVAAALFPDAGPAILPAGPGEPEPVRVRCRGGWHEVRSRRGVLDLPHTPEEQQRERAMRAFGGAVAGCFAVQESWVSGEGRLPRALRAQRQELFLRAQHGDTPGVVAMLDAGVDPRIRDSRRRGLLHVLHQLDHRALLPRLLAAGLDLEAKDSAQRTPLLSAVHWGGSADLVRALLAAGSRIDVVDEMDLSLSQEIRRYKRTDLAFLRRRVDEEFPDIGADWWDEYMEEREDDEDDEDGYEDDAADEDDVDDAAADEKDDDEDDAA
ncbi:MULTISPECIES: ankyrin repeat domain-containing protein [unclassified Streptomyces]|uniref:ankyrin repeat domain-containing protein n=1 Tax=unclassified Streptomyces TaxID=2593676 RepID=UPI001BEC78A0|nr:MULTISPECIES: ankyrin repeat domain-containing protein [unclassified Streptomyces]MBT2405187.1 ankyrin repeat domain-containing protein [Streptomyces sp. ISL-21]MBT2610955.1 ankyrin repeat domain-containing protein [Streptomyces sp. ISL-87]